MYVEGGSCMVELIDFVARGSGKVCEKCSGKDKNQPIEGLIIVKGLTQDNGVWTDGDIMDPANGKSYDCTIKLDDDNTLNVRGFLGFSFLGRTQVWKRKL